MKKAQLFRAVALATLASLASACCSSRAARRAGDHSHAAEHAEPSRRPTR